MMVSHAAPRPPQPAPHVHRAWMAAALLPVVLLVGFTAGSALVGDPNAADAYTGWDAAWRVVVLWLGVVLVPVLGVVWAMEGRRRHEAGAGGPLVVNGLIVLLLTGTTLVGGLLDSL